MKFTRNVLGTSLALAAMLGLCGLQATARPNPVVLSAEDSSLAIAVVPNPVPQSPGHSVSLSWILSAGAGIINQNVYRAACTGTVSAGVCSTDASATFAKLPAGTAIAATLTTYSDTTVAAGSSYIYYVTAVCPATGACVGESVPSNHVAATIPGNVPPPPTGLSITNIALNTNGTSSTVVASWSDTNTGTGQYFAFTDGAKFLAQGLTSSLTGTFAEEVTVPVGTRVTFLACDTLGACATQKVN